MSAQPAFRLPPVPAAVSGCLPALFVMLASLIAASHATADPTPDAREFTVANGSFSLAAPADWQRVRPRSMIVETEFSVPPVGEDSQAGRMTVMGAGGSIEANIDRWCGQFSQPDGSKTADKTTTKKLRIAGCQVTLVDITGTYKDMPGGPFAGGRAVDRPDYRMLAAIIETEHAGNYFVKFYGPAATVGKSVAGFRTMVEGMVATGK